MAADRRQLYKYKGDKCAACGVTVQEMVDRFGTFHRLFELNHVDPLKKHPKYDNLIRRRISTEQIDEVDKCVLLCRNCHGVVHAQNINAEVLVQVRAGPRQIERRLKGQMILDYKDRCGQFLTDERAFLHPYRVHVGNEPGRIVFGEELWQGEFISLMQRANSVEAINITAWNGRPMVAIRRCDDGACKVSLDMSFPVIRAELHIDKDDPVFLWVRNGIGLTRDGEVMRHGMLTFTTESLNAFSMLAD